MGRLPDCRLSALRGTIGKEDSVKETQEGCLSRAINDFLNVITFKKSQAACRKDFFDKLGRTWSARPQKTVQGRCAHRKKVQTQRTAGG